MSRFLVNRDLKHEIVTSSNSNIQKWQRSIVFQFNCELNARSNIVTVEEKLLDNSTFNNTKHIINIS